MFRIDGLFDYKRALYATVAVVSVAGVGLIAYRLWCRRRPSNRKDRLPRVAPSSTVSGFRQFHRSEDKRPVEQTSSEVELLTSSRTKKQTSGMFMDPTGAGDVPMTSSETFEKVPSSISPVGFEEIGASYVESMSLPSTPPLIIGHPPSPPIPASEALTVSTMSFIAVSSESDLPQDDLRQLSMELGTVQSEEQTSGTENNDIIVIGANSSYSSEFGSEDVEVASSSVEDPELPPDVTDRPPVRESPETTPTDITDEPNDTDP